MGIVWGIVIVILTAAVTSAAIYPFVLRFAIGHNIVDNPDWRKFQRNPVPVMGGVAVYIGIIVAVLLSYLLFHSGILLSALAAMTVMLILGCWDDMKDLSASLRFLVEIVVVWFLMFATKGYINDFHGLWGIHGIGMSISIPLSVVAGVGIINAINLIDGVNGYSSGYGIIACIIFGTAFVLTNNYSMGTLCFVTAGALLPFFVHNVFGKTSRMFIGDGGTLMLGTLLTLCVFSTLSSGSPSKTLETKGISLVAFALAVMAIPVFDTLRVMTARMIRGSSPFRPDKTHLHHLFIDCDFSHIGTTICLLSAQLAIILIWWISWKLGACIDLQVYIVILMGLMTWAFYYLMRRSQKRKGRAYRHFVGLGIALHVNQTDFFKTIRKKVDGNIRKD